MIVFTFTQEEREAAAREGRRRQEYAERHGSKGNNWAKHDGSLYMNMIGAAGEMAVASYLGMKEYLYKEESPVKESCDLPGIDVKTRGRHHYDLIVHVNERIDHKTFWLVTIEHGETRIHGWMPGPECAQQRWLRQDKVQPCYFVPQRMLYSPESGLAGF